MSANKLTYDAYDARKLVEFAQRRGDVMFRYFNHGAGRCGKLQSLLLCTRTSDNNVIQYNDFNGG